MYWQGRDRTVPLASLLAEHNCRSVGRLLLSDGLGWLRVFDCPQAGCSPSGTPFHSLVR